MLPTAASLLVSEQCNLRCKYCFELGHHHNSLMKPETAKRAIEFLYENALRSKNTDQVHIILFGGEPMLNPDGIESALQTGYKLQDETGIPFSVALITNSTIMNDRYKEMFTEANEKLKEFSVQVSVDGIKEAHDVNRVTVAGEGTFDKIMEIIPTWQEILNTKDNPHKLCVHTCLSESNMQYFYESWKYFMEVWRTPYIWFMPIHSDTYTIEDVKSYKKQLTMIAEDLVNKTLRDKDLYWIRTYSPIDRCLQDREGFCAPCGAGKNFCTITAEGIVNPCHQIYFNDTEGSTNIGDIWNGIDEMKQLIFVDYGPEDMNCAKENPDCDCYNCYRCLADNWGKYKTILNSVREERCMMSHVERDVNGWIQSVLASAGLININEEGKVSQRG